MNLRDTGEDRLLERLVSVLGKQKTAILASGDDCAVVPAPAAGRLLLLKTDCVVEGIHFDGTAKAEDVGWKAMMRPLSDFAAMAGLPEFALVTLVVPGRSPVKWTTDLYRGLRSAARRFDVSIVGGETSNTTGPTVISVSVSGSVERGRWVSRGGGKPGDDLFVTGRLGGSRRGRHLRFIPRIEEARWLTRHFRIHAMMDLSDGLGADLPRLARASRLDYAVEMEAIPRTPGCGVRNAISDGEDYELLFALSPRHRSRLLEAWRRKFPRLALARIGSLGKNSKDRNGRLHGGYVHFK